MRSVQEADQPVRIGLVGKYVNLPDAYLSVVEALRHVRARREGPQRGGRVQTGTDPTFV